MRLTVLSPHLDDATFSLALALRGWSEAGICITVVNFFTQSAYAPYAPAGSDVSWLRAREDRLSIRMVSPGIRIRSFSLLDAPLRRNIEFGSITNPDAFSPLREEIEEFTRIIRALARNSLILAPLALGEHIDHRTIHCAALRAGIGRNLGFYEDLPYASWTPEDAIQQRVGAAGAELRYPLTRALRRGPGGRFKARAVAQYRSQIDRGMVKTIAQFAQKYHGAERIWIPRHSACWRAVLEN